MNAFNTKRIAMYTSNRGAAFQPVVAEMQLESDSHARFVIEVGAVVTERSVRFPKHLAQSN